MDTDIAYGSFYRSIGVSRDSVDVKVRDARLVISGRLQIYACHDGSLEVYLDGRDIKELLDINESGMWFDFGQAVLALETSPGSETETRPKSFGKDVITRAEADEKRRMLEEEIPF